MPITKLAFDKDKQDEITDAFFEAASYLHKKGSINAKDLNHKSVKKLTDTSYKILKDGLDTGLKTQVPDEMRMRLENDVFLFSGLKTYAQLKEASLLLRDKEAFTSFANDIQALNSTYNLNYLRAEHQYAIAAAQSAAQWKQWEQSGDRYLLQLRTAQDDKVRASHSVLHNITLPMSDKFWLKYMVPLDWGCRCRVIQVLKSKYQASNSADAIKLGESATPEMFRYNPGIQQIIFPPNHPYTKLNAEVKNTVLEQLKEQQTISVKKFKNGGSIHSSILVNNTDSDYNTILACCTHFAAQGMRTEIMPKININSPLYKVYFKELIGTKYEGKCPDFKVNNNFYEHEGFVTENAKNAMYNMMRRGFKQCDKIIMEDAGIPDNVIRKNCINRIKEGQYINEVWVKKGNKLRLVFKNKAAK